MASLLQEEREFQEELETLPLDEYRERVKQDVEDFISGSPSRSRGSKSQSPNRRYQDVSTPSPSSKYGSPGSGRKSGSKNETGFDAGLQHFSTLVSEEVDENRRKYDAKQARIKTLKPGSRVRRGEHWNWGDQDGGAGSFGTVKSYDDTLNWAAVRWDNGHEGKYRWGQSKGPETLWDLEVVNNAPPAPHASSSSASPAAHTSSASGHSAGPGGSSGSFVPPSRKAETLYKAMKGLGTDEDAIYKTLESVEDAAEWEAVKREFKRSHGSFCKGDLVEALLDELTAKEEQKVEAILSRKGIRLVDEGLIERLNGFAKKLHDAMKGFGTDEDAIYQVLGELDNQAEWNWVRRQFKREYPSFNKGDVVAALKSELTKKEEEKCQKMFAAKGMTLFD